jgi:hypothetical protein
MQHSKIVLNKYQDWIHVDRLIQPEGNIFINADHPSLPILRPLSKLIYLQVEPDVVTASRSFLLQNWRFYTHIITYDDVVLSRCPNAVKYVFATCWIPHKDYDNIDISLKKFQISSLVGSKSFAPGHNMRHELYMRQKELHHFPLTIYISTHGTPLLNISNNVPLPNGDKMSLFKEFQFSIVIENVSQNTWFTEKLIDCLITKTIPIYW